MTAPESKGGHPVVLEGSKTLIQRRYAAIATCFDIIEDSGVRSAPDGKGFYRCLLVKEPTS